MSDNNQRKPKSPYKALYQRNANYCGYVSMSSLEPNKCYQIYKLQHTVHEKFGTGELAFISNNNDRKQRVQLPGKYLKEMTEDQIDALYRDIEDKKYPFLIYRETMPDKSFLIDVLPDGPEMQEFFKSWKDVPPVSELEFLNLDSSAESNTSTDQPAPKKAKGSGDDTK